MFSKNSGIYCFENKINKNKYIGQSINLDKRIKEHIRALNKGKDYSVVLQKAWNKYGEESFDIYIICECPIDELNDKEIFYIDFFKSRSNKNGYNVLLGGNLGFKNHKHSEESKKRMSLSHIGKKTRGGGKWSEESKSKRRGYKHTEETKIKMSYSQHNNKKGDLYGADHHWFGKKMQGASSKYYGVCKILSHKTLIRYKVKIYVMGKEINLGQYKIEEDAAMEYDKYVIENNLPNPLNFPLDKK